MRRRDLLAGLAGALTARPRGAIAQARDGVRRVGVLMGLSERDPLAQAEVVAFRRALDELGWTEGRNLRLEIRWSAGDIGEIRSFAKELVEQQPDVIVGRATPTIAALLQRTRTVPIVFAVVSDPVQLGFVGSLAQPGGNVTGFTNFELSLGGKWIELLKEAAPHLTRVVLLFNPQTTPWSEPYFMRSFEVAARSVLLTPIAAPVDDDAGIASAVAAHADRRDAGLLALPDTFLAARIKLIADLALAHGLPSLFSNRSFTANGGLMAYAVETRELFRRAAAYVDRILRGAKPADLPVQQPTKLDLSINLKTAKALGLTMPPSLLVRADEVIE